MKIKEPFVLIDSEEKHRIYPDTWNHDATHPIWPGLLVYIGVASEDGGERFWCRAQSVDISGNIKVKCVQEGMCQTACHGIHLGSILNVERRHIMDIMYEQ